MRVAAPRPQCQRFACYRLADSTASHVGADARRQVRLFGRGRLWVARCAAPAAAQARVGAGAALSALSVLAVTHAFIGILVMMVLGCVALAACQTARPMPWSQVVDPADGETTASLGTDGEARPDAQLQDAMPDAADVKAGPDATKADANPGADATKADGQGDAVPQCPYWTRVVPDRWARAAANHMGVVGVLATTDGSGAPQSLYLDELSDGCSDPKETKLGLWEYEDLGISTVWSGLVNQKPYWHIYFLHGSNTFRSVPIGGGEMMETAKPFYPWGTDPVFGTFTQPPLPWRNGIMKWYFRASDPTIRIITAPDVVEEVDVSCAVNTEDMKMLYTVLPITDTEAIVTGGGTKGILTRRINVQGGGCKITSGYEVVGDAIPLVVASGCLQAWAPVTGPYSKTRGWYWLARHPQTLLNQLEPLSTAKFYFDYNYFDVGEQIWKLSSKPIAAPGSQHVQFEVLEDTSLSAPHKGFGGVHINADCTRGSAVYVGSESGSLSDQLIAAGVDGSVAVIDRPWSDGNYLVLLQRPDMPDACIAWGDSCGVCGATSCDGGGNPCLAFCGEGGQCKVAPQDRAISGGFCSKGQVIKPAEPNFSVLPAN